MSTLSSYVCIGLLIGNAMAGCCSNTDCYVTYQSTEDLCFMKAEYPTQLHEGFDDIATHLEETGKQLIDTSYKGTRGIRLLPKQTHVQHQKDSVCDQKLADEYTMAIPIYDIHV
eukprot:686870_1